MCFLQTRYLSYNTGLQTCQTQNSSPENFGENQRFPQGIVWSRWTSYLCFCFDLLVSCPKRDVCSQNHIFPRNSSDKIILKLMWMINHFRYILLIWLGKERGQCKLVVLDGFTDFLFIYLSLFLRNLKQSMLFVHMSTHGWL